MFCLVRAPTWSLFSMKDRSRSPSRKDSNGSPQGTSRARQAAGQATRRTAFVTLATQDYRQGALVLTAGLRSRLPDTIDVIVFSDAELSLVPGVEMRRLSSLPDIPVPGFAGEPLMPNFKFCWKKLGLWSLEEYEVIVYMDADILILGNILSILESTPPVGMLAAVPACECWRSETCNYTASDLNDDSAFYFNAGVLVLRPKKSDFHNMMQSTQSTAWMQNSMTRGEMPFAEQDFLNLFFEKKVCRLSPVFNALQHALKNPKHQALNISNCIALHFVMGKPWAPTKLDEDFVDLHNLWRNSFQEFSRQATARSARPSWDLCRVDPKLPLFLVKDYISAETEATLLASIYGESLSDRWVALSSRRLLCLGGVPHPDGAICEALPVSIEDIGHKLVQAGGLSGSPNQCLINSYVPGQGIDAHSDGPRFESEVAILTLEGPALMYFGLVEKKAYPAHPQRLEVLLEPRSLLVMSGDAYDLYVHRIGHVKVDITKAGEEIPRAPRRTSLTLRRLKHVLPVSQSVMDEERQLLQDAFDSWRSQPPKNPLAKCFEDFLEDVGAFFASMPVAVAPELFLKMDCFLHCERVQSAHAVAKKE